MEEEGEEEGEDGDGRWSLKNNAIILIGLEVLEFLLLFKSMLVLF